MNYLIRQTLTTSKNKISGQSLQNNAKKLKMKHAKTFGKNLTLNIFTFKEQKFKKIA